MHVGRSWHFRLHGRKNPAATVPGAPWQAGLTYELVFGSWGASKVLKVESACNASYGFAAQFTCTGREVSMQPVPHSAIEVLEAQIAERLPRPLKGQASSMATIIVRALGGEIPDLHPAEGERNFGSLKVALLKKLGVSSPDANESLGHAFNEHMTNYRHGHARFQNDSIEIDRLVSLAFMLVTSSPGVSFHYKNLGEILIRSGRPELAIHWLQFGRRFHARGYNSKSIISQNDRVIYSMFMRDEAHCHADLGNFAQAIDLRLKAHALNADDPDFSAIEKWSEESVIDEPIRNLNIGGGGRLSALIMAVSSVAIMTSESKGEELAKHVSPSRDLPSPLVLGDVKQIFTKHIPETMLSIEKFNDIEVYTNYWKTSINDSAGRLIRSISSGSSELPILAQRTGLGPTYLDLPGITAVVTFNHNWFEYYHWLIEIAHRVGFIIESGIDFDNLVAHGAHTRSYCQEFLSLTGLDSKNVLGGKEPIAVRVSEAIIPSRPQFISSFGIDFLKSLYLGQSPMRADRGRRVFISRQKAKDRRIINYDQVHEVVASAGFEVLTFEDMDVRTQARIMYEAEIVVAPHGAGLSNVIFCEPGTTVVEFLPATSPVVFQTLSHQCGLNYTAIHAERSGSDMTVDVSHLKAALASVGVV